MDGDDGGFMAMMSAGGSGAAAASGSAKPPPQRTHGSSHPVSARSSSSSSSVVINLDEDAAEATLPRVAGRRPTSIQEAMRAVGVNRANAADGSSSDSGSESSEVEDLTGDGDQSDLEPRAKVEVAEPARSKARPRVGLGRPAGGARTSSPAAGLLLGRAGGSKQGTTKKTASSVSAKGTLFGFGLVRTSSGGKRRPGVGLKRSK